MSIWDPQSHIRQYERETEALENTASRKARAPGRWIGPYTHLNVFSLDMFLSKQKTGTKEGRSERRKEGTKQRSNAGPKQDTTKKRKP